jgi:hypothetical protein
MSTKLTDAQVRAKKNWDDKNREHSSYLKSRSSAKSFIRNKATLEDLEELEKLIEERKLQCQKPRD